MGNLARSGYGATEEGMLPYSYDTCDFAITNGQGDGSSNLRAQRLSYVYDFHHPTLLTLSSSEHAHVLLNEPKEITLDRLELTGTHQRVVVHPRSISSGT